MDVLRHAAGLPRQPSAASKSEDKYPALELNLELNGRKPCLHVLFVATIVMCMDICIVVAVAATVVLYACCCLPAVLPVLPCMTRT